MKNRGFLVGLAAALSLIVFFMPFASWQAWIGDSLYDSVFTQSLGGLPVQRAGRVMPISSASADILRSIGGKSTAYINGKKVSSSKWLWLANAKPEMMASQNIIRTDNRDLLSLLEGEGMRFSYDSFAKHYDAVYNSATSTKSPYSDAGEKALGAGINYALASGAIAHTFPECEGAADSINKWKESVKIAAAEFENARKENRKPDDRKLIDASGRLERLKRVAEFESSYTDSILRSIPVEGVFYTPSQVLLDKKLYGSRILMLYAMIRDDISMDDRESAAAHLSELEKLLKESGIGLSKIRLENIFNAVDPFFGGFMLYGISLLLYGVSAISKRRGAWLGSFASVVLFSAICAHILGIVARMYIQGRPPVTNLYSSVVFTGAVAAALGLFLYARKKYLSLAFGSAALGFLSLLVAQNLPYSGDTMGMMRAVLNSNFWLTVHVVTIMVGYCGVFLAGFISAVRLVANVFSRGNFGEASGQIAKSVYAILCFALLFSFAGTMLGGIWADMSWGRFWGWDPKENGALMIVLWVAACIHSKALKMCSDRAFLAMAVFGNIIAAWAWFGVNLMGVGLHAYGFISGGWSWFFAFVISQLLIVSLALVKYKDRPI